MPDLVRIYPKPQKYSKNKMEDLATKFVVGKRYHVLKYISHGSQAIVYQAYDTQTKQLYALKRYKFFQQMDDKSQKEAISEYEVLQKINNKNIMRCFDVIQQGQDLFIVAELINGITLERFVNQQFIQCIMPKISYDKLIKLLEPYETNKQSKFQILIQPVFKQYWKNMQSFTLSDSILKLLMKTNDQFNQQLFTKLRKDDVQNKFRDNKTQQWQTNQQSNISNLHPTQRDLITYIDNEPGKVVEQAVAQKRQIYKQNWRQITPSTTKPPTRSATPTVETRQMNRNIYESRERLYRKQITKTQTVFGDSFWSRYKNALYEDVVIDFCKQLLNMQKCLYQNKLLHRDVCPNNIMVVVDERGRLQLKLIDFGLCRPLDGCEATIAGTPGFLRPDLYNLILNGQGRSQSSESIDIWSFGAVAYYMLHGLPPVPAPKSLVARRFYTAEGLQLPMNQTLRSPLKNFLNQALNGRNPSTRTLLKALSAGNERQKGLINKFTCFSVFSSCIEPPVALKAIIVTASGQLPAITNAQKVVKHNGKSVNLKISVINDASAISSQRLQNTHVSVIFFSDVKGFQHTQQIHATTSKAGFTGKTIYVYNPVSNIDYKLAETADFVWKNSNSNGFCAQKPINGLRQCICDAYFHALQQHNLNNQHQQ